MPLPPAALWKEPVRRALAAYRETLVRSVAGKLLQPRNSWPVQELITRIVDTLEDVPLIDRRLRHLPRVQRKLLALIGHSSNLVWNLGNLVELLMAFGEQDGLHPVLDLLGAGLLFPFVAEDGPTQTFNDLQHWLLFGAAQELVVLAHPLAAQRALGGYLGLDCCPGATEAVASPVEADGLDWPLRLAVLWQQLSTAPLRRTQQGEFFKRDLERLSSDPLLNASPSEGVPGLPDMGFLTVCLGETLGLVHETEGEVRAGSFPTSWEEGLPAVLAELFRTLFRLSGWNPLDGWRHGEPGANPFPSAYLLSLLLLGQLQSEQWADPDAIQEWLLEHHPYWQPEDMRPSRKTSWVSTFLLGLAWPLRVVQMSRDVEGRPVVRLAPLGRWMLGLASTPPDAAGFPQTLLVQPNLEIVAYRQGLTPALISKLARFAQWRSLGSACTLQLGPESVYRSLEGGLDLDDILLTLTRHGSRATPPAVVEALRTWSNKRERISVYPSAALLEFNSPEEMNQAFARGFPGVPLTDRLAVVAGESVIDYRHFRLLCSKDYTASPERCVEVGEDGVTLTIDLARSDLLLETELARFAEPVRSASPEQRVYRLTPASLAGAREAGLSLQALEMWFQQRTGGAVPPAGLMLFGGLPSRPAPMLRRLLVLQVASETLADGLMQWPATRELIEMRLGPLSLAVREERAQQLQQRLAEIGLPAENAGDPRG